MTLKVQGHWAGAEAHGQKERGGGGGGNKVPGLLQQIESGGLKREGEREGAAAAMRSLLLSFAANCSWGGGLPPPSVCARARCVGERGRCVRTQRERRRQWTYGLRREGGREGRGQQLVKRERGREFVGRRGSVVCCACAPETDPICYVQRRRRGIPGGRREGERGKEPS